MKILFVENHARFARLTARQFLAAHEVTIVPGVEAARDALAISAFDAVLVDYDLDDGKGDELVRELAGQGARPAVIATSSHDRSNQAMLNAGADAVCGKMEFQKVEAILEEALDRRKAIV